MRPLLVLALVIGALGALLFAVLRVQSPGSTPALPGGSEAGAVPAVPRDDAEVAPPAPAGGGTPSTAPAGAGPTRETAAGAPELVFENALRGRVVDQGGGPIEGARVVLTQASAMAALMLKDYGDASRDRRAFTDAEGRFRFENVLPYDYYSLIVTHDDYSRSTAANVRVGERGEYVEHDVTLLRGSTLSGYVRDENGSPIGGAMLALYQGPQVVIGDAPGERKLARTDGGGRYAIANIAPGLYSLDVRADGFGNVTATNQSFRRSKPQEKDFTLQAAGMIGGRVLGPDGSPLPGAVVRATSYGDGGKQLSRGEAQTDAKGAFRLDDLRPGTFTLLVNAPGYRPGRVDRVETGELGLTVRLQRRSVITGRVLGPDGPVTQGEVELRHQQEHDPRTSPAGIEARFSDPEGRYQLVGVPPGTYVVDARASGFAPTFSAPFTVVEDQSGGRDVAGIDVRLTRGGAIVGRVVDPAGDPVRGARVTTHDNEWGDDPLARLLGSDFPSNATARAVRTGADGTFRLDGLRPELYQVRVHTDDWVTDIRYDQRVTEGGELRLGDVRLAKGGVVRGTLFDKSGERLAGGELKLDGAGGAGGRPRLFRTKSDPDGRFELGGVPAGAYELRASRPPGPDVDPLISVMEGGQSKRNVIVREDEVTHQDMTIGG